MKSRYAWCRSPAVWGVVGYHHTIVSEYVKVLSMGTQMSGPQYGVPGAVSRGGTTPCRFPVTLCRRRKHMKRSIVAVVCLVLVIGFGFWMAGKESTPEREVRRYLSYLAKGEPCRWLIPVYPTIRGSS